MGRRCVLMAFRHQNRLIFALAYELEPHPGYVGRELIVWLKEDGNAERDDIQPLPPNTRIVTTKPGQEILLRGKRERVLKVAVYRGLPPVEGERR